MAMANFSWVLPNTLAGSELPGADSPDVALLKEDVTYLADEGVRLLVSLVRPRGPVEKLCEDAGIAWRYFPIPDFGIPASGNGFTGLVDDCCASMKNNAPVCVHCHAGIGRTGMVLACIVGAYLGLDDEKAVATVRRMRGAIETREQRAFIDRFLRTHAP